MARVMATPQVCRPRPHRQARTLRIQGWSATVIDNDLGRQDTQHPRRGPPLYLAARNPRRARGPGHFSRSRLLPRGATKGGYLRVRAQRSAHLRSRRSQREGARVFCGRAQREPHSHDGLGNGGYSRLGESRGASGVGTGAGRAVVRPVRAVPHGRARRVRGHRQGR